MARDEARLGVWLEVLRASQDGHEVRQRLSTRPDHLSLQEHGPSPHGKQIQVSTVMSHPFFNNPFSLVIHILLCGTDLDTLYFLRDSVLQKFASVVNPARSLGTKVCE